MDYIYKVVFAVGVLYTFISFIISGISGAFHFGSHLDGGGGHGHIGGTDGHTGGHVGTHSGDTGVQHGDPGNAAFSWLTILINPIVAVSFLTVFGGLGILGTDYFKWAQVIILLIALPAGIIVAALLYRFVAIPLYRSENSSHVSREDLVTKPAEVISHIFENGFGEIRYSVNSIRYTAPARHIEGKAVEQGRKVVICKVENNVFYVTEMQEL